MGRLIKDEKEIVDEHKRECVAGKELAQFKQSIHEKYNFNVR